MLRDSSTWDVELQICSPRAFSLICWDPDDPATVVAAAVCTKYRGMVWRKGKIEWMFVVVAVVVVPDRTFHNLRLLIRRIPWCLEPIIDLFRGFYFVICFAGLLLSNTHYWYYHPARLNIKKIKRKKAVASPSIFLHSSYVGMFFMLSS